MAAITEPQLSARIKAALDAKSDDPSVNTVDARQHLADELASAINDFVVGRTTQVTGVQVGSGTAPGIIQNV
ncbi:MAG: hypothetical protein PSN34_06260 [Urechidicola sp.]|nr:hypothetical protein [Urechidicola sp.]